MDEWCILKSMSISMDAVQNIVKYHLLLAIWLDIKYIAFTK